MCLAYASGKGEATDFVEISDGLLLFANGAVAGPLIASVLMDRFGTGHVFVFTSVVHGVMALWTYWAFSAAQFVTPDERSEYVLMTRTSPNTIAIDPRADTVSPGTTERRAEEGTD
ncbi:MAG: hypothetical protein OXF40_12860 [Rhodospirillales bacterium]|nr:hypothetical protein [Rhodospirillales bacterium]